MASTQPNLDFKALAESLRSSVAKLGGFNPQQVRKDASLGEEALQRRILLALANGPLSGTEIIADLQANSKTVKPIAAADVYPVLEKLQDLGLVASAVSGDRRSFKLTTDGASAASAFEPTLESSETQDESPFNLVPTWIDLRGTLAKSGARLAKVAAEVAQFGTKEQQDRAAVAIEEATKKIHGILGES